MPSGQYQTDPGPMAIPVRPTTSASTKQEQHTPRLLHSQAAGEAREVVQDQVEELARVGARETLMAALNEEVDAYLGRGRCERIENAPG